MNDLIRKEFGSLGKFCRESGFSKATLSLLVRGRYGGIEAKMLRRVNEKLKELRPELDLSNIWSVNYEWYQKWVVEKSFVKNGFRITVDCRMGEDGQLTIAPFVEGY